MTIDEAVKELTKQLGPKYPYPDTPFHNAMKLSIEALTGIKKVRKTLEPYVTALLPGETKETGK
ncbi:hypothetical protein ES703_25471 [subsurface metagenome]